MSAAPDRIRTLVLFGASGDLARRFLLPAVDELKQLEVLPRGFRVVGVGADEWNDAPPELSYRQVDVTASADVEDVMRSEVDGPVAAYLALPPTRFVPAIEALARAGLPTGSVVVVEKPYGADLEDTVTVSHLLAQAGGCYRVDHVLGMATVHNLLALRSDAAVFGALWDRESIEAVDILWEETLALEERAAYYDHAGALVDVVQSHLLQLLALLTMEPPADIGARGPKVEALRAVRLATPTAAAATQRGRYTAGELADGRQVRGYADEDGVDPRRATETFGEVMLTVDTPRWAGVPFRLRAGKALARRWKGVVVRFRASAASALALPRTGDAIELHIGIDGPMTTTLRPGSSRDWWDARPVEAVAADSPATPASAYATVLRDILSGSRRLSVSAAEAELSWRLVTPVLDAWRAGGVPLLDYPAGSTGPPRLATPPAQRRKPPAGRGL